MQMLRLCVDSNRCIRRRAEVQLFWCGASRVPLARSVVFSVSCPAATARRWHPHTHTHSTETDTRTQCLLCSRGQHTQPRPPIPPKRNARTSVCGPAPPSSLTRRPPPGLALLTFERAARQMQHRLVSQAMAQWCSGHARRMHADAVAAHRRRHRLAATRPVLVKRVLLDRPTVVAWSIWTVRPWKGVAWGCVGGASIGGLRAQRVVALDEPPPRRFGRTAYHNGCTEASLGTVLAAQGWAGSWWRREASLWAHRLNTAATDAPFWTALAALTDRQARGGSAAQPRRARAAAGLWGVAGARARAADAGAAGAPRTNDVDTAPHPKLSASLTSRTLKPRS